MKFMKQVIGTMAILGMFAFLFSVNLVMAQSSTAANNSEEVITNMVEAVQQKDWETFSKLMCSSEQEYYDYYFEDDSYTNGIKQVESVTLIEIYSVDLSAVESELLYEEYPILSESSTISAYIVALDCDTNTENQYFFNGINYFLIVLVEENGYMKIVQFNRPSSSLLEDVVTSTLSNSDDNYERELAGINVIEQAENGLAVNANNEILTNGFEAKSVIEISNDNESVIGEDIENGAGINADGTTDFPNLDTYSNYSYPSTISVKLNKTGDGSTVTVDFDTYIRNTLPNEWYSSWNSESLKSGAYCVKMVGWYRTLKPVSSSGGYDVTQGTQYYVPNTEVTTTNNAFDAIDGYGMADSTNKLFFPEYAAGTKGSAGTQSCGQLKQWGSQYLATEKGYTYEQILNYYYAGSSYSTGSLVFFSY